MLRYLIQVVENLLAPGILISLLWAAIDKTGGEDRKWRALWGCAAGTGAALILAVLRRTTALINRSVFNQWTLSFAVVLGIAVLYFLWAKPKQAGGGEAAAEGSRKRPFFGGDLPGTVNALLLAALFFYALPTIFLYPTEFALTGETIFSTDFLFKLIGFCAGLFAAALTALALYRTARQGSFRFLRAALSVVLVVSVCNQFILVVQFLMARRIIPIIRWLFRIVAAAVNNQIIFLYMLMGISFSLPLALFITGLRQPRTGKNPAESRKIRAGLRTSRLRCLTLTAGFAFSVLALTVIKDYTRREVVLSPAEPMTLEGEEILIPITQVEDGHLHRFVYTASDNTEVRFIVIKKNAVAYGVGLDACDICGPTGYYERKNEVICRLCDVVMNISTIGFKGGCNPVPLAYSLRSGSMVIETIDLENEKTRFH
jgi:uncharacterized membrane protein